MVTLPPLRTRKPKPTLSRRNGFGTGIVLAPGPLPEWARALAPRRSPARSLPLLDPRALRFTLSEPATVTLLVNGAAEVKSEPAGTFAVPPPRAGVQTVTAQARDAAGNVSATVSG